MKEKTIIAFTHPTDREPREEAQPWPRRLYSAGHDLRADPIERGEYYYDCPHNWIAASYQLVRGT